jgi:hypothetical protein
MPKFTFALNPNKAQAQLNLFIPSTSQQTNTKDKQSIQVKSIDLPIAKSLKAPINNINYVKYACASDGIEFQVYEPSKPTKSNFSYFLQANIHPKLQNTSGFIFARFNQKDTKPTFEVCLQTGKYTVQIHEQKLQDNEHIPHGYSNSESLGDMGTEFMAKTNASIQRMLHVPKAELEKQATKILTGVLVSTEIDLNNTYQASYDKSMKNRIGENVAEIRNFKG